MKLSDVLKPDDGKKEITSLRKLVRQKSLKSQLVALKSSSNPKDEDHNECDLWGDGTGESK